MIREVDLVDYYLPPFMLVYKEPVETLDAEQPEFQLAWKASNKVLYNRFISTADEYGIARFEKILHIRPSIEDTLDIRRARVQSQWFVTLPYTWKMFVQKIIDICGTDYPVSITRVESYLIKLEAGIELQWQIESLINVVEKMLPCNMGMAIKNVMPLDLETSAPTIRPDWFGYGIEYRGEINADENVLLIKMVCMHVLIPFGGEGLYNGERKYNGTIRYNAKRNYELHVKMKNVMQLYTEQMVRYAAVLLGGRIQHKFGADMFMIFYYFSRLKEMMHVSMVIHTGLRSPGGDVANISIETKRNVVRYGGTRRYNGAMRYNALYRKEQIE